MPSRVRGIERLLGGKARSFFEFDFICAVCKRQVDWNRAAVRRAVIAAANGIGLADAPNLCPLVFSGDIRAAAPFCRASGGYINPTACGALPRIVKGGEFVFPLHSRLILHGLFAGFFVCGILLGSRRRILCRVFFGVRGRGILTRAGLCRGGLFFFFFFQRRCRDLCFLRCTDRLFRRLSLCCQRPGGGQGQAEGDRQKQAQYTFFHQVFLRLTSVVGNKPQLFGCGFGFAAPLYTQFF